LTVSEVLLSSLCFLFRSSLIFLLDKASFGFSLKATNCANSNLVISYKGLDECDSNEDSELNEMRDKGKSKSITSLTEPEYPENQAEMEKIQQKHKAWNHHQKVHSPKTCKNCSQLPNPNRI
jgi:hypothetical protein